MNIGDRVRLLHGKEQGIVKRITKDGLIEIEIEDGFVIPVLRSELALVAAAEQQYFKKGTENLKKAEEKPIQRAEKGIYLAFVPAQLSQFSVHLINNTDFSLAYSLVLGEKGLSGGFLGPKQAQQGAYDLRMERLDEWSNVHFQALYHANGSFKPKEPFLKKQRLKANFFQNKKPVPLSTVEGFVLQLDATPSDFVLPAAIEPGVVMSATKAALPTVKLSEGHAFDLHIEHVDASLASGNAVDILNAQLAAFDTYFDQALVAGLHSVTFIHGVGSGRLREEVQRRLSKNTHVAFFKDARKEKFGYGATEVVIK